LSGKEGALLSCGSGLGPSKKLGVGDDDLDEVFSVPVLKACFNEFLKLVTCLFQVFAIIGSKGLTLPYTLPLLID
jgi:hypothetical protein